MRGRKTIAKMPLLSLKNVKVITEILFWISLFVVLASFLKGFLNLFFIFLAISSLIFLGYFVILWLMGKKEGSLENKSRDKQDKQKPVEISRGRAIINVYGTLSIALIVIFFISPNLFWILLILSTLLGYNISNNYTAKKQEAKNPKNQEADIAKKELGNKELKGAVNRGILSKFFAIRTLTSQEAKERELLNKKLVEVKSAEKMIKLENLKEKKRLKELLKKIEDERRLKGNELKTEAKEKEMKGMAKKKMNQNLEKEKKRLESLEREKQRIIDEEAKLEKIKKGEADTAAPKTKEPAIQLKGTYETDLDRLVNFVERYEKIKLSEVAEIFRIDKKIAEEWAGILEQHNLLAIHYPAIGEPELRSIKR